MNISNSEIAFLGYNSYPANGFLYYQVESESIIINNTIHDMWDGFYSHSSGFIKFIKNEFYNNHRYGIDPHSGSHDIDIMGNVVYNNSLIGIICSENCYRILFDNNTVHNNGVAGLMFSLQTNNSIAKNNYAYNEKAGISVFSSSNNEVYNNTLKLDGTGIFIGGNSSRNSISNNTIMDSMIGIDSEDSVQGNVFENNDAYNVSTYYNDWNDNVSKYDIKSNVIINSDQANESMIQKTTTIYGCESTGDFEYLHCDPFKSKIEGNGTSDISTKISDITREPFYVNGKNGKAIDLIDSYNEYVEISPNNLYNSSELSISFWVKKTENAKQASPYAHVISHVSIDGKNGWYFENNSSNDQSIRFIVSNTSGGKTITKDMPISNTSFTHIAATFDGSLIEVYRNGDLFQTLNYDGNYSSAHGLPIHIGSASHCNSCLLFNGIIDDIIMYNRTISEDEIKQLYLEIENNTGTTNNGLNSDKDLVGHWSFDNTLDDHSIYKNKAQMFTLLSSMVATPDDRIFITEKNTGKIKIMKDGVLLDKPFAVINDSYVGWEQGLLGLAVDPDFENNNFIYLFYTTSDNKTGEPFDRIMRFTDIDNKGSNITIIPERIPASIGYHSGGALAFGPDDKLYITIGDATQNTNCGILVNSTGEPCPSQDPSNLLGKVLRINKNGTIPSDNPFPNSPVYTLGHRNMFGIAFDNKDNIGIVTENGDVLYDEINLIKKGGNYGFPTFQPANISPELSNSTVDIKPLRSYWKTQGPTQALYYTGDKFPSFKDNFLFGTYTGDIYAVHIDNASETIDSEQHIQVNNYPFESVIGITQTSDGNIYYGANHIYKLDSVSKGKDSSTSTIPYNYNSI